MQLLDSQQIERNVAHWRQQFQSQQASLRTQFFAKPNTKGLIKQQCKLVDVLLLDIASRLHLPTSLCLVAVGGYGRGELFPYSDIDLLILLPADPSPELNQQIEQMVGVLWDIGLSVGHSVRTLNECVDEAAKDVTVQTNMLEARLLSGSKYLFKTFWHQLLQLIDANEFYQAKVKEQDQRHAKFNDTSHNLEPNVKESPGGLRDLQTILWIANGANLGNTWHALLKQNIITAHELRLIKKHEQNLQMLRVRLHYLANRREDRLIFDFQNDLAEQLGLKNTRQRRASEQLMARFYTSAKYVILINEILLLAIQERIFTGAHQVSKLGAYFESRNGLLATTSANLLQRKPSAILEIFLMLEKHPELQGISPSLLRSLARVKTLVNREFRQSAQNKALFMRIIKQPQGVQHALKLMNRYGILGSYLPVFGKIVGQMQHDLFHVYTVDEHILNVLSNLYRFSQAVYSHEFPLCSQLFAQFKKPHLLYLAALFHDIAKGRGGDHSTLGTHDAMVFCKSHGLNATDSKLVAWLVEAHLMMSSVAQKSDLSDMEVIRHFAHYVKNARQLTALYLLTVADIRGTSPKVWNAWKAKLLENLYYATMRYLEGTQTNTESMVKSRQQKAMETLSYYGIGQASYSALWSKLGNAYFIRHESQEVAWHTRLLTVHMDAPMPIVRTRLSPAGDGIQVMLYTHDQSDLFARTCSFFERLGYTILEAKIHTTNHGFALDTFLVLDPNDKSVSYRDLLSYIEYELTQKLRSSQPLEEPLQGRLNRQVKHMPITPQLMLKPMNNSMNYQLSIATNDRPGLLSRMAHVFMQHQLRLHTAKINTLGNRAEDTFLISSNTGEKLTESQLKILEKDLINSL